MERTSRPGRVRPSEAVSVMVDLLVIGLHSSTRDACASNRWLAVPDFSDQIRVPRSKGVERGLGVRDRLPRADEDAERVAGGVGELEQRLRRVLRAVQEQRGPEGLGSVAVSV